MISIHFDIYDPEDHETYHHILLQNPAKYLVNMVDAQKIAIRKRKIKILYDYPLGTSGPSSLEKTLQGWVFEEVPPNNERYFTNAGLAQVISDRYKQIYQEEEETSAIAEGGHESLKFNRNTTNGKYGLWGHVLSDLNLIYVKYLEKYDVFRLGVDS